MILPAVGASVLLAVSTLLVVATRRPRVTTRLVGSLAGEWLSRYRDRRERSLESAHVTTGYRQYAAFTLVYAAGAGISVAVLSGGLAALALSMFAFPTDVRWLTSALVAGWLGVVSGVTLYWVRWWWPRHTAVARGRRIDATMPRTVAFLYALSRNGMPVPEVLRAFADNEAVYGEAAAEISLTVREMDLAGADLVSALEATARRTPSPEFEEFLANVTSVLRSGQALPEFLETQYERYQDGAEAKQERLLTQYATLAEVYVTALVAGPLFLLTILVVIGLTLDDTLRALGALVYIVLPLSNLVFVIYLSTLSEPMRPGEVGRAGTTEFGGAVNVRRRRRALPDGGEYERSRRRSRNEAYLASYERMRGLRERFSNPLGSVRERPERLLYLTVPLAILVALARLWSPLMEGTIDVRAVDDVLVQSGLFVLLTYAWLAAGNERSLGSSGRYRTFSGGSRASTRPAFLSPTASTGFGGVTSVFSRSSSTGSGGISSGVPTSRARSGGSNVGCRRLPSRGWSRS